MCIGPGLLLRDCWEVATQTTVDGVLLREVTVHTRAIGERIVQTKEIRARGRPPQTVVTTTLGGEAETQEFETDWEWLFKPTITPNDLVNVDELHTDLDPYKPASAGQGETTRQRTFERVAQVPMLQAGLTGSEPITVTGTTNMTLPKPLDEEYTNTQSLQISMNDSTQADHVQTSQQPSEAQQWPGTTYLGSQQMTHDSNANTSPYQDYQDQVQQGVNGPNSAGPSQTTADHRSTNAVQNPFCVERIPPNADRANAGAGGKQYSANHTGFEQLKQQNNGSYAGPYDASFNGGGAQYSANSEFQQLPQQNVWQSKTDQQRQLDDSWANVGGREWQQTFDARQAQQQQPSQNTTGRNVDMNLRTVVPQPTQDEDQASSSQEGSQGFNTTYQSVQT